MNVQERLILLRQHLHDRPSSRSWRQICELMDGWPMDESARLIETNYAKEHLCRWPDRLRVAPQSWIQSIVVSPRSVQSVPPHPAWSLVRAITLDRFELFEPTARAIFGSLHMREISILTLSNNHMGGRASAILARAEHMDSLRQLSIVDNPIGPAGLGTILASSMSEGLSRLELVGRLGLGPAAARELTASEVLGRLHHLDLCGVGLGSVGVGVLTSSPKVTGLIHLGLGSNRLGPDGAARLARSPHLQGLIHLDLSCNHIGDEGAEALAKADFLGGLHKLVLHSNGIGRRGYEALSRARVLSPTLSRMMARRAEKWKVDW